MIVGILIINDGESLSDIKSDVSVKEISKALNERNYFVESAIFVTKKENVFLTFELLKTQCEALLVLGGIDTFFDVISQTYVVNRLLSTVEIDNFPIALTNEYSQAFLIDTLLPMLNSKCRTFYATAVFKTFGKTEEELREILKLYIKNRNRIFFKFYPSLMECEVNVRYSNKTARDVVNEIISGVTKALCDCTYALKNESLNETVANLLILHGKKLAIAESFTGGGVSASLVSVAGISAILKEAIVCYNNESKIHRLGVEKSIIEQYGAVSIETVYEMAANILMSSGCDLTVATTGNAGPTSEKPDENGICFIAVGDSSAIHIYRYNFKGNRKTVIDSGIKASLFRLYKLLTADEFKIQISEQSEK